MALGIEPNALCTVDKHVTMVIISHPPPVRLQEPSHQNHHKKSVRPFLQFPDFSQGVDSAEPLAKAVR